MASEIAGAAELEPGMPQLDFSTFPNQIFWLVVALIIIYILMARIALPRIAKVLAERADAIQRDLDQAEDMKQKAKEAEQTYNKALADARAQANEIIASAKADMQANLDKAIAKADAEIAAKSAESEAAIKEIRDNATAAVQQVATATTKDVIDAVMPGLSDEKAIKAAVANRMKG